jgi:hypothetical protein
MASEDSVENLLLRDSSVLAITVDGVGKPDQLNDPFASPMPTLVD